MSFEPPPPLSDLTRDFLRRVENPEVFTELFDVLPRIYLYVKDRRHRFMKANRAELQLHGCRTEEEIVGRSDFDFHPPVLAAQYVEEDRRVFTTRQPLVDQMWLVQGFQGIPQWYISSKFPIFGKRGAVIGIAGVMRPYDHAGEAPGEYLRLTRACERVLADYAQPISVSELAKTANLSKSQFQREFRRLFRMSAGDYVLRVRLLMARRQLETTHVPVGRVALENGFYDQSHFSRAFRTATGLSPLGYRKRFAAKLGTISGSAVKD